MNNKCIVLLMLRNESEVKVRPEVITDKVCLLLLTVGLILWAKHAGLFVACFYEGFIFN